MNCNLLNKEENEILRTAILKCLSSVYAYNLKYKNGLTICAFIQIDFEEKISLVISTGDRADNIVIIDESDFKKEKEKYRLQDDVELKLCVVNDLQEIIGDKLIDVECEQKPDEEYYWLLKFKFQKKILNISALIDALEFSTSSSG